MVEDTYHVRATFLDTEPLPSVEANITIAPAVEGAYLRHAPYLFIFNDVGSGKIVKVRRVAIRTIAGQGQVTLLPTNLQVNRITAITSDGETVVPGKADSAAGSLPSQVKIQQYAQCTDESGSEFVRILNGIPQQNLTRALALCSTPKFQTGEVKRGGYACQGVSSLVLREGEGLTIHNVAVPFSMAWRIFIVLQTGGGVTYYISEVVRSVDDIRDLITIFNGSGSGVILNVLSVILMEAGTDEVPFTNLYRIDGYKGGDDLTVLKMDNNSSIPSSIKVRSEGEVTLFGHCMGAVIANPKYRRIPLNTWGTGPGLAGVDMKSQLETMIMYDNIGSVSAEPIILQEGDGIAMMQAENASGLGRWATSVTFTVYTPSVGGSNTYSRGRVVNG